jgi:hypothetical protein
LTEGSAAGDGQTAAPARRRTGLRLIVVLAIAAGAVLLVFVAATVLGGPGRKVETGVVIAVHATSLSNVDGFTIRTPDGRNIDFRMGAIEDATTFSPSHLAVHEVTLRPIRVTYVDTPNGPLAVRLDDAN